MALIITLDGPAASGKSSAACILSKRLHLPYLDSGGIYRAIAWKVLKEGIPPQDVSRIEGLCKDTQITLGTDHEKAASVWVDAEDATPFLRDPEVTRVASVLSTLPVVRHHLLSLQRNVAKNGVVAEGRDMGTVIFPYADLKFYLDATLPVRANRRFQELQLKGIPCDLHTVLHDIEERDRRDQCRAVAPLYPAADAMLLDSTTLSLEQVVATIEQALQSKNNH